MTAAATANEKNKSWKHNQQSCKVLFLAVETVMIILKENHGKAPIAV